MILSPYIYLGIIFIFFGGLINIWTDNLFKGRKTTVKPFDPPAFLEVRGPFRISRHPMYLGMCAILLGTAILLGSIVTFFSPFVFIVLMEILFIPMEEKSLENEFGQEYLNYKKRVRRWI